MVRAQRQRLLSFGNGLVYSKAMEGTFRERLQKPQPKKHRSEDHAEVMLRALGGEPLAGSGFENEEPEAVFNDSDTPF